MDRSVSLYVVKLTVAAVFACLCFWRAWEARGTHRSLANGAFGAFLLLQAVTIGYRLDARLIPDLISSRALLDSPGFFITELLATASLVVLFFVLQRPSE